MRLCAKNKLYNHHNGQTMMEYASLITIVLLIFLSMGTYLRRGIQGIIKVTADQIGSQSNSEQTFDERGHLVNSVTMSRTATDKERREQLGVVNYIYNDQSYIESFSYLNAGFTPRPPN